MSIGPRRATTAALAVILIGGFAGCTATVTPVSASPPAAEQESSRGEKIAAAFADARAAAERAANRPAAAATPALGLPADRLYPKCDSVAYVSAGTAEVGASWTVEIVSAPIDTGEATGATGSIRMDADGVPAVYTVAAGDVLNQIAARLCFGASGIGMLNELDAESTIYPGDRLYLYADESLPFVQRDPYPAP